MYEWISYRLIYTVCIAFCSLCEGTVGNMIRAWRFSSFPTAFIFCTFRKNSTKVLCRLSYSYNFCRDNTRTVVKLSLSYTGHQRWYKRYLDTSFVEFFDLFGIFRGFAALGDVQLTQNHYLFLQPTTLLYLLVTISIRLKFNCVPDSQRHTREHTVTFDTLQHYTSIVRQKS